MDQVIDFIQTNRDRYINELKQYLAIPSITALPEHIDEFHRIAEIALDESGHHRIDRVPEELDAVVVGREGCRVLIAHDEVVGGRFVERDLEVGERALVEAGLG